MACGSVLVLFLSDKLVELPSTLSPPFLCVIFGRGRSLRFVLSPCILAKLAWFWCFPLPSLLHGRLLVGHPQVAIPSAPCLIHFAFVDTATAIAIALVQGEASSTSQVWSTLSCGRCRSTGGITVERCVVVRRKPKTRKTWIGGDDMAVQMCATRTCHARRRGGTLVRVERTRRLQARVAARAKEDGKMEIVHVEQCADGAKIIRFGTAEEARNASVQETKKVEAEHPPPRVDMEPRELEQVQEETVGSGGMLHEVEAVETPTVSTESDNLVHTNEETKNETVPSQDSKDMSSLKVAELRALAKQKGITVSVAKNSCVGWRIETERTRG